MLFLFRTKGAESILFIFLFFYSGIRSRISVCGSLMTSRTSQKMKVILFVWCFKCSKVMIVKMINNCMVYLWLTLGSGSLRAKFELSNGPSTPSTLAVQFMNEGSTLSGVDMDLQGAGYRLSLNKKRFATGLLA